MRLLKKMVSNINKDKEFIIIQKKIYLESDGVYVEENKIVDISNTISKKLMEELEDNNGVCLDDFEDEICSIRMKIVGEKKNQEFEKVPIFLIYKNGNQWLTEVGNDTTDWELLGFLTAMQEDLKLKLANELTTRNDDESVL